MLLWQLPQYWPCPLSGCSFNDVMLYLYGGDSFTKEEGEDYQTYDGENGISVTYDANIWNEPSMSQEDTIGITTGNKLSYTAVLLQVSDAYTDIFGRIRRGIERGSPDRAV